MSALRPSNYSQMTITSADGSKTIDFSLAVATIQFFEDIFCPTITCKIIIGTAGGSIEGKNGKLVSLYEGMGIHGGEQVRLRIEANTPDNLPIDRMSDPLYVRSVSDVIRGESSDFYVLNLTSKEAYQNEISFLQKKYTKDVPISSHVENIITEFFPEAVNTNIEQTANPYGFITLSQGAQLKPFEAITKLASESVPIGTPSAGFFFYQTLEGFQFRSVDGLIREGKENVDARRKYVYTEVAYSHYDYQPTPDLPSLDQKISNYDIKTNRDFIKKLMMGTYSSSRKYFDPVTFNVTGDERKFGLPDYTPETLGDPYKKSDYSPETLGINFSERPTKILTGNLDRGTLFKEVTKDFTKDINEYQAQKRMRYNSLFSQIMTITVPLNTTIHAGDVIECKVPQISDEVGTEFEAGEVSGFYLIKEISHYFDTTGSYTAMKLLRDTYSQ